MKEKLLKLLGLPDTAPDEQIVAAVGGLRSKIADLETLVTDLQKASAPAVVKIDPRIRQKMAAGLSFQQATEVLANQDAEDKAAKKAGK